ncbi:hypothetical protein ABK040_005380 [Willaertia magna]
MGIKACKPQEDIIIEPEYFSQNQKVFQFQLSKYEFPPKEQFSQAVYEAHITKDYKTLEQEYISSNKGE